MLLKTTKLTLERLNDRIVPAYLWNPQGTSTAFGLESNWTDSTTGLPATSPLNPGTDCEFPTASTSTATVTGSVGVRSIKNDNWPGTIKLGGALNIHGMNGVNSSFKRGTIEATSSSAILNLKGGEFLYEAAYMNNVADKPMTTYVSNSGLLKITGGTPGFNSSIHLGKDSEGYSSAGTLTVSTTNMIPFKKGTENTNLIKVYSNSTVNVNSGGINAASIENSGEFYLNGGNVKTVVAEAGVFNSLGGKVQVADSTAYLVYGNMYFENSSLVMGSTANNYSTLQVIGNLEFGTGSVYHIDVNQNSLTQADNAEADNITIATNASLILESGINPLGVGTHQHKILYGVDSLNGMFGTVTNNGTAWITDYVTNTKKLFLGLPPLEDEGPPM